MKRAILLGNDPKLRRKADAVDPAELQSQDTQQRIDELFEIMLTADGLGLAAPQVGESKRLIIVMQDSTPTCLVNPSFTPTSQERELGEEGCLSFPGLYGKVARYKHISVSALDRHGKQIKLNVSDMNARVIQHEIDHLNGVLLPDRLKEKESAPEAVTAGKTL